MALPMVEVETLCPNSSSKAWRCSSRVRSSLASRCCGSHSLSITPLLEGLPGIGLGLTSPVSRRLFSQRFMVGIETEKVLATSSLGLPESTAASTLNLRSFEYGFMPGGYHIMDQSLRVPLSELRYGEVQRITPAQRPQDRRRGDAHIVGDYGCYIRIHQTAGRGLRASGRDIT
jgi:hypothetical protein